MPEELEEKCRFVDWCHCILLNKPCHLTGMDKAHPNYSSQNESSCDDYRPSRGTESPVNK